MQKKWLSRAVFPLFRRLFGKECIILQHYEENVFDMGGCRPDGSNDSGGMLHE
jgi:hypothetical protein